MPKYSVCITNYNTMKTIRQSMESILTQLNDDFEVVVCDNCSNDGSREVLEEYAKQRKIKLIVEKSSRGKGRQIAFENSTGNYIISGLDTDDILKPTFKKFLEIYHNQHEGYMLSAGTVHVIPTPLAEIVGGWRDLKWGEDVDFRKRVESISKWHELKAPLPILERGHAKRGPLYKLKERYNFYQCRYRIGMSVYGEVKMNPWYDRHILFVIATVALIICKISGTRRFQYNPTIER